MPCALPRSSSQSCCPSGYCLTKTPSDQRIRGLLARPMLGHLWDNLLRGSPRRNSISENGGFLSAGVAFGLLLSFQCCCTQSQLQSLIHSPDQSCHPPFFHVPNHVSYVSPVSGQGFPDLVVNPLRKPGWLKVAAFLHRMSLQTALHLSWCPCGLDKKPCCPHQGWGRMGMGRGI